MKKEVNLSNEIFKEIENFEQNDENVKLENFHDPLVMEEIDLKTEPITGASNLYHDHLRKRFILEGNAEKEENLVDSGNEGEHEEKISNSEIEIESIETIESKPEVTAPETPLTPFSNQVSLDRLNVL